MQWLGERRPAAAVTGVELRGLPAPMSRLFRRPPSPPFRFHGDRVPVQDPSDDPNRRKIAEETPIEIVGRQKLVAEHEKGYLGTGDKLPAAAQDAVPVLLIEIVTDTRPPRHAASSRLRIQRRSHKLLMARPSAASRAAWIVPQPQLQPAEQHQNYINVAEMEGPMEAMRLSVLVPSIQTSTLIWCAR
ncbi:hypothetical protein EJB05_28420, partial [Eragrostis curvula]